MSIHRKTVVCLAVGTLTLVVPTVLRAQAAQQSVRTDPRWYPWLGCWQSDTSAASHSIPSHTETCVVPVAGSSAVDALTILRGRVIVRDRLDASGRTHAISDQGCDGFETVNWSSNERRVYLRSNYTCVGGTKGTSTTLFALSTTGDWVHVTDVRSGGGSIVTVDRRRDVGVGTQVPQTFARAIGRLQLAVTTARAAAAVPVTADDIIDALHRVDAAVVRSWLIGSDQQFNLDQHQLLALARAGAPPSVMQAVMSTPARYRDSLATVSNRNADAYLNTRVYSTSQTAQGAAATYPRMTTMYVCPPNGCYAPNPYPAYNPPNAYPYPSYGYEPYPYGYSAPFIVRRGEGREPFRGREEHHEPPPRGGLIGVRP